MDRALLLDVLAAQVPELGEVLDRMLITRLGVSRRRAVEVRNSVLGDMWLAIASGKRDTVTLEELEQMARRKLLFDAKEERRRLERPFEYAREHGVVPRVSEGEPPNQAVEQEELLAVIWRALDDVSERQKQCWVLTKLDKLTDDEVAQRLGLAADTVRHYTHRAQQAVDGALGRYNRNAEAGSSFRGLY